MNIPNNPGAYRSLTLIRQELTLALESSESAEGTFEHLMEADRFSYSHLYDYAYEAKQDTKDLNSRRYGEGLMDGADALRDHTSGLTAEHNGGEEQRKNCQQALERATAQLDGLGGFAGLRREIDQARGYARDGDRPSESMAGYLDDAASTIKELGGAGQDVAEDSRPEGYGPSDVSRAGAAAFDFIEETEDSLDDADDEAMKVWSAQTSASLYTEFATTTVDRLLSLARQREETPNEEQPAARPLQVLETPVVVGYPPPVVEPVSRPRPKATLQDSLDSGNRLLRDLWSKAGHSLESFKPMTINDIAPAKRSGSTL